MESTTLTEEHRQIPTNHTIMAKHRFEAFSPADPLTITTSTNDINIVAPDNHHTEAVHTTTVRTHVRSIDTVLADERNVSRYKDLSLTTIVFERDEHTIRPSHCIVAEGLTSHQSMLSISCLDEACALQ